MHSVSEYTEHFAHTVSLSYPETSEFDDQRICLPKFHLVAVSHRVIGHLLRLAPVPRDLGSMRMGL